MHITSWFNTLSILYDWFYFSSFVERFSQVAGDSVFSYVSLTVLVELTGSPNTRMLLWQVLFSQAHGTFVYLPLGPKVKSLPATTSGHTLPVRGLFL